MSERSERIHEHNDPRIMRLLSGAKLDRTYA